MNFDSTAPPLSTDPIFSRVLQKVPHGLDLTGKVIVVDGSTPNERGGHGDVFLGFYQVPGDRVAVKRLRVDVGDSGRRNFARELNVWYRLKHPNVLPLLGYLLEENRLSFVSKWMEEGSLRLAIKNKTIRVSFCMTMGIARGLSYLHSMKVIHADLKTDNVLLSPTGVPLLTDFGISKVDPSSSSSPAFSSSGSDRGSLRWKAYEFFDYNQTSTSPNEKTDVWAFGMTLLELITGELPFSNIKDDLKVASAISHQKLPPEPAFSASGSPSCIILKLYMWSICKKCWVMDPKDRPFMNAILQDMEDYHE